MPRSIPAGELIALFERMARERWAYVPGAAREGACDCSGAFVWAYRRFGLTLPHGSNSILRRSALPPGKIPRPGYAAFKLRPWTDRGHRYYGSPPGDAYHMGLVSRDGKHILNAKDSASGFVISTLRGWDCFAPLKAAEYGKETEGMTLGTVTGNGVRLRASAPRGEILTHFARGTPVEILERQDGWLRVRAGGQEGWVSGDYVREEASGDILARYTLTVARDGDITLVREGAADG